MDSAKGRNVQTVVNFEKVNARVSQENLSEYRNLYREMCESASFRLSGRYVAREVEMAADDNPLKLRVYRPDGYGQFPIVVFFHGGGWIGGDTDTCASLCQVLADVANVVVVAPNYRLAPEWGISAPFEDACRAFDWAVANAADIDGDAEVVAVAGEGTGAYLAAFVVQRALSMGQTLPVLQLLIDPEFSNWSFHELFKPPFASIADAVAFLSGSEWWSGESNQFVESLSGEDRVALGIEQGPPVTLVIGGANALEDVYLNKFVKDLAGKGGAVGMKFYSEDRQGFVCPYGEEGNNGGVALRYAARMLRYSLRQGWDPLLGLER